MAETNPTATPPRRGRWRTVLLVASLALNLVIVGLVAGAIFGGRDGHSPRHLDRVSMGLGDYIRALPAEARETVMNAGGGFERSDRRGRIKAIRASRAELRAALEAEPFDPDAVRAAIVAHRDGALSSTVAVQDAFLEAFAALSPEERAAVVEEARANRKNRREKWRKKRDKEK